MFTSVVILILFLATPIFLDTTYPMSPSGYGKLSIQHQEALGFGFVDPHN
jgi:hypothetical protein